MCTIGVRSVDANMGTTVMQQNHPTVASRADAAATSQNGVVWSAMAPGLTMRLCGKQKTNVPVMVALSAMHSCLCHMMLIYPSWFSPNQGVRNHESLLVQSAA
mmetsp:Transcript_530/g.1170  ORF Transcript_530/g.1170 Transcript_530/m.1170 type:complete len:103 (+) Transcript_530:475-783(+)